MKFKASFFKEWTERGSVEIEADNAVDAREIADEMLASEESEIEWEGSNMEPGNQGIDSILSIE